MTGDVPVRQVEARMIRDSAPLLLLWALALGGCSERPVLLIEVSSPSTFQLDSAKGELTAVLRRSPGREVVVDNTIEGSLLDQRKRLFGGLELEPGDRYSLELTVALDGADVCPGRRAVGRTPPFSYAEGLTSLAIYVACADSSGETGDLKTQRVLHTATWVPRPAPYGRVIVTGGGNLQLSDPEKLVDGVENYDTVEAYDPRSGLFRPVDARIAGARFLHRATRVSDGLLLTGGFTLDKSGAVTRVVSLSTVERFDGETSVLQQPLKQARGAHTVTPLAGDRLMVAKGSTSFPKYQRSIEIYDTAKGKPLELIDNARAVGRVLPAAVALPGGKRALLIGGLFLGGLPVVNELVCVDSSCGCGKTCIDGWKTGFSAGAGRLGMTATAVTCEDDPKRGAFYVVGGHHRTLAGQLTVYDEVLCGDLGDVAAGMKRVGKLSRPRTGHTTTLVRGPDDTRRLFVAGGTTPKKLARNQLDLDGTADLVTVGCTCEQLSSKELATVTLRNPRALHTATLLPDGSVLLTGGALKGSERFVPDF